MIGRRQFIGATAAASFALPAASGPLPPFSWDTLPVYTHAGKTEGDFTAEEVRSLARFPLVTIEKAQAQKIGRSCEEGIYVAARQIKTANADTKVLFYLNAVIDWPGYEAAAEFERHPEWTLRDRKGEVVLFNKRRQFDLSNPYLRDWWTDICAKAMRAAPLDGVFMDALPKIAMVETTNRARYGDDKYEALAVGAMELLKLTKQKIGRDRILLFNGLRGDRTRWKDGGMRYLKFADAAMMEHFAAVSAAGPDNALKKEWVIADMELMREASAMGKGVFVKAWPRFATRFPDTSAYPQDQAARVEQARREIGFSLALFLAAAEEHNRFLYTWGYRSDDGALVWFAEYSARLGPPKGRAIRSGDRFTREFRHARVTVDLETRQGQVEWT